MASYDLTPAQIRVVRSLNAALVKARCAGLAICGMDRNLLVYNGRAFDDLEDSGKFESAYEIQIEMGQGIELDAGGVYRDSGGW